MANYNKLIKNTAIFAVGSFSSKILTFIIAPLYTYFLTTSEYGEIDIYVTLINLIYPFISLMIQEAAIRFLLAKEINQKAITSTCMMVFVFGIGLFFLGFPIYNLTVPNSKYLLLFSIAAILTSYHTIFNQLLRAQGKTVAFAINGIMYTAVFLTSNVLFIMVLRLGISGYFYSMILSLLVTSIHATICARVFPDFSIREIKMEYIKPMLKYCIPLIPNKLVWLMMNACDKFVIKSFIGEDANGLYALAFKIPTIISMMFNLFSQAWEMNIIEDSDEKQLRTSYADVFSMMLSGLAIALSGISLIIHPVFVLITEESFTESWRLVPILGLSTLLCCLAVFFGSIYIVNKQSVRSLWTISLGLLLNLVLSIIFVQTPLGLYGVALGTALGFALSFVIRFIDLKRKTKVEISIFKTSAILALLTLQTTFPLFLGGIPKAVADLLVLGVIMALSINEIKGVLHMLFEKLNRRKNKFKA